MMIPLSNLNLNLLLLLKDPESEAHLNNAWIAFRRHRSRANGATHAIEQDFLNLVEFTEQQAIVCHCCEVALFLNDDMSSETYCQGCYDVVFTTCTDCGDDVAYGDAVAPNNGEAWYCHGCANDLFEFCETCEGYFDDGHRHDCDCTAPNLKFTFPNGDSPLTPNERVKIVLPKGTIDDVGMERIVSFIYAEGIIPWQKCDDIVRSVGPEWQTKRGNFTRRLSSAYYKMAKENNASSDRWRTVIPTKLEDETISAIGNISRQHSSEGMEWHIELTRELNGTSAEFGNAGSCWWISYYASRCALKNWGGLALRSYHSSDADDYPSDDPSGRAWVQPLCVDPNGVLQPTHNTTDPHAYLIYNGYGDMSGYVAPRIIAQMTSKTYKRVELDASPQYINGGIGYLVADETTCAATTRISYYSEEHFKYDADTYKETRTA